MPVPVETMPLACLLEKKGPDRLITGGGPDRLIVAPLLLVLAFFSYLSSCWACFLLLLRLPLVEVVVVLGDPVRSLLLCSLVPPRWAVLFWGVGPWLAFPGYRSPS